MDLIKPPFYEFVQPDSSQPGWLGNEFYSAFGDQANGEALCYVPLSTCAGGGSGSGIVCGESSALKERKLPETSQVSLLKAAIIA